MLKQWLDAGKCLIGAHQGDWAFEADAACDMVQVCRVCGQETRKTEHLWSTWSPPGTDDCSSTRACTRCREIEARVEHDWDAPAYREPRRCEQARPCRRCGAWHDDDSALVVHVWSAWGYSEAYRCPVRQCVRCRTTATCFGAEVPGDAGIANTPAPSEGAAAAVDGTEPYGRYQPILDEYAAVLVRDGLSEYAMQEAINHVKELPADPDEDPRLLFEATIRLFDLSMPYADDETAQTLAAFRQSLQQQYAALTEDAGRLGAADASAQAEQILNDLQASLAAGEPPGVQAAKAITAFQSLLSRVDDADEESMKALMGQMFRIQEILLPYAPAGARQAAEEANVLTGMISEAIDLSPDDRVGYTVLEQRINEQRGRAMPTLDAWTVSTELEAVPHVRRFSELLPRLMDRMFDPALDAVTAAGDRGEVKRLRDRLDARLGLVRHARTEAELVAPQREGLRRTAIEFRQFERRRHVMVADSVFPTNVITPDANRLFFSGSASVGALVDEAVQRIGMSMPPPHGVANRTYGRWQQLRESAIGVFDYSNYEPAVADPPGARLLSPEAEKTILEAAGPIATVAYETGWAYVLGKAVVTISRRHRPVPFDIDIHPVLLEDTSEDGDRLLSAVQAAFYGTPHGMPGDCVEATIEHVRERFGDSGDAETKALVSALTAADATRTRLLLQAIADRVPGRQPLVTVPTFPGCYPSGRTVFHVTAFRDWTRAAQEETRAACTRAGFEYRIGYERIGADILLEVWKDICGSALIVADLTQLNPNAALELGIAQALGRRTLILTQDRQPHLYFPPVEKVRTHHYDPDRGRAALSSLLDRFLAGAD